MFNTIKTQDDIVEFLEKTNQLHDGHIISVVYNDKGIEKIENKYSYSLWMNVLTIRILVTSLWDATVEIEFEGLYKWQIKDHFTYIFATTLSFNDEGHIIFADNIWTNHEELQTCSYVIARSMKWRIIE